jgi:hypothetical protein
MIRFEGVDDGWMQDVKEPSMDDWAIVRHQSLALIGFRVGMSV